MKGRGRIVAEAGYLDCLPWKVALGEVVHSWGEKHLSPQVGY